MTTQEELAEETTAGGHRGENSHMTRLERLEQAGKAGEKVSENMPGGPNELEKPKQAGKVGKNVLGEPAGQGNQEGERDR